MRRCGGMMVALTGLALAVVFSGCAASRTATPPALGTKAWYLEVERTTGVVDKVGHGPDTGSTEWLEAVSRVVKIYDEQGHGPDLGSDEWKRCVHRTVFKQEPSK